MRQAVARRFALLAAALLLVAGGFAPSAGATGHVAGASVARPAGSPDAPDVLRSPAVDRPAGALPTAERPVSPDAAPGGTAAAPEFARAGDRSAPVPPPAGSRPGTPRGRAPPENPAQLLS